MKRFIQTWLVTTLGVMVASNVVRGIHADTIQTALVASLILGFLNAFIRPVLMILTLPIMLLSLGLFTFILNAFLIYFTGWLVKGFYVESFWAAFKGGLVISLISLVASLLLPKPAQAPLPPSGGPASGPSPGGGPVIDV